MRLLQITTFLCSFSFFLVFLSDFLFDVSTVVVIIAEENISLKNGATISGPSSSSALLSLFRIWLTLLAVYCSGGAKRKTVVHDGIQNIISYLSLNSGERELSLRKEELEQDIVSQT